MPGLPEQEARPVPGAGIVQSSWSLLSDAPRRARSAKATDQKFSNSAALARNPGIPDRAQERKSQKVLPKAVAHGLQVTSAVPTTITPKEAGR